MTLLEAAEKPDTRPGRERRIAMYLVVVAVLVALPLVARELGISFLSSPKLLPIALFIILALGLNVVVGFAGLLDLGYAAFFDRSKNRSATWCSMSICGNRTKNRAYYRRQRA